MAFNPFEEKGIPIEKQFRSFAELNVEPYDKMAVHPYTRCRAITMNGIEVEAAMFSHQFARHTTDLDLKRKLALVRRAEQQQQKMINWLIPGEETTLEVTIGYEQVAVDLTAWIARHEPNGYARRAYEFGLLEDFDHLYRYANLMDLTEPRKAEEVVQMLTEIMPGRPTALEHRHPHDDVRKALDRNTDDPQSLLNALTVMAAEQQTMNFYMTIGNRPTEPIARALYAEIAEIEEQHVTHYESLLDAGASWAEMLVLHEYNECWLYHSFMETEVDPRIRGIWEHHLAMEIEHLRVAAELLRELDGKEAQEMLPKTLPDALTFEPNKQYVRDVLAAQVGLTGDGTEFVPGENVDGRWREYRDIVNNPDSPAEVIIRQHKDAKGVDYRMTTDGPHPVDGVASAAQ